MYCLLYSCSHRFLFHEGLDLSNEKGGCSCVFIAIINDFLKVIDHTLRSATTFQKISLQLNNGCPTIFNCVPVAIGIKGFCKIVQLYCQLFCFRTSLSYQLLNMPIDFRYHLRRSLSNGIKRCLQLRRFLAVRTASNISKAIVRGINSIMLTYRIGNRLRFNLLTISREDILSCLRGLLIRIYGMELLMSHLMNGCFDGLDLAHILLNGNSSFDLMVITLGPGRDAFKFHRHRAGTFQRFEKHFKLLNITSQLIYSK